MRVRPVGGLDVGQQPGAGDRGRFQVGQQVSGLASEPEWKGGLDGTAAGGGREQGAGGRLRLRGLKPEGCWRRRRRDLGDHGLLTAYWRLTTDRDVVGMVPGAAGEHVAAEGKRAAGSVTRAVPHGDEAGQGDWLVVAGQQAKAVALGGGHGRSKEQRVGGRSIQAVAELRCHNSYQPYLAG